MQRRLLIFGIMLVLLLSCSPIYVPNNHSTPLLREQGEIHAAINTGTNGTDIKFAASPVNGIGVIAGYQRITQDEDQNNSLKNVFKLDYKEVGVGRYGTLGKNLILENYLGAGIGWMEGNQSFFLQDDGRTTGKYRKFFMLTNLGQNFRFLDWGIGFRFAYTHFYSLEQNNQEITANSNQTSAFFLENHLFLRAGPELIKFQLQFGTAKAYRSLVFDYDPFYISLGIHLNFRYAK